MKHPDEQIMLCPSCRVRIACDNGIVPRHGKLVAGVAVWPCAGVGMRGEVIREKKSK